LRKTVEVLQKSGTAAGAALRPDKKQRRIPLGANRAARRTGRTTMRSTEIRTRTTATIAAAALAMSLALPLHAAQAAQKTYLMKISTPLIHDTPNVWISAYAAMLEKDSGGRIKVKVYPASQLGSIPRQVEGTQFDSIQCEVVSPSFMVGLDPRFQVLAAPGLVGSQAEAQRVAEDPAIRKLMLGLGADKGLHGVALFFVAPGIVISKTPLRHLADFKGKKIRIFASPFQTLAFERLGMTPVALSLGDVLPALQEGTIDTALVGAIGGAVDFHMIDVAKYITNTNGPGTFMIVEINKKWYESLPKDLQQFVDRDAAKEDMAIGPIAAKITDGFTQKWTASGGSLIQLSAADYAEMHKLLDSVGAQVSSKNPKLAAAFKIVTQAAKRAASTAN
jgi:TRAP-type transport system periplasmic protein